MKQKKLCGSSCSMKSRAAAAAGRFGEILQRVERFQRWNLFFYAYRAARYILLAQPASTRQVGKTGLSYSIGDITKNAIGILDRITKDKNIWIFY